MSMIASGDLRAYLRGLSHQVWADQNDAIQHGFCLQEETITEMLMLRIARDLSPYGLKMRMFTKGEEGGHTKKDGTVVKEGNGADWEWFMDLPDCMVGFRIQAKRLFPSLTKPGAYNSFHAGGKQIDQLINAAGKLNPIYVLYNHDNAKESSRFSRSSATNWYGRSSWGCSVATAEFMKTLTTNLLTDVFPGTVPWHRYFSIGNGDRYGCAVDRIMKRMAGDQEFRTTDTKPDWVEDLLIDKMSGSPGADEPVDLPDFFEVGRERFSALLTERQLQGVAYFDFRGFES